MSSGVADSAQPSGASAADDNRPAAGAEDDNNAAASRLGFVGTVSQSAESSSSKGSGDPIGELTTRSDCADCRSSMLVYELSLLVWPGRPNSAWTASIRRCLQAHVPVSRESTYVTEAGKLPQADVQRLAVNKDVVLHKHAL